MRSLSNEQAGFTLLEFLVVVICVGILAALIISFR
jgi:prepilin-type N-terminal cleavage/methylation domain-containing protein